MGQQREWYLSLRCQLFANTCYRWRTASRHLPLPPLAISYQPGLYRARFRSPRPVPHPYLGFVRRCRLHGIRLCTFRPSLHSLWHHRLPRSNRTSDLRSQHDEVSGQLADRRAPWRSRLPASCGPDHRADNCVSHILVDGGYYAAACVHGHCGLLRRGVCSFIFCPAGYIERRACKGGRRGRRADGSVVGAEGMCPLLELWI